MNRRNYLIRMEYQVAVSSHYRATFIQLVDFAEKMCDAPRVTIQKTFRKTYCKLPVSMFTCVKRQPVIIYNINATQ